MAKHPKKLFDTPCLLTGELFESRAENHFEKNDGKPFAPPVEFARPTVRQRVENLLNRGTDVMAHYVGNDTYEMDIPDDPEADLTPSEQNYIDLLASDLAENAPLPDDNLPRQSQVAPQPPQGLQEQVSSPAPGPQSPPQPAAPAGTVPSR